MLLFLFCFTFVFLRFANFFSLFLGVAVIFITDHMSVTLSSPSSPGCSIQVQIIGRCLNLITLSTRTRQIKSSQPLASGDLTWFRQHKSATVTKSRHNQTPFPACFNNLPKDSAHVLTRYRWEEPTVQC
jgi:hypothetical protein